MIATSESKTMLLAAFLCGTFFALLISSFVIKRKLGSEQETSGKKQEVQVRSRELSGPTRINTPNGSDVDHGSSRPSEITTYPSTGVSGIIEEETESVRAGTKKKKKGKIKRAFHKIKKMSSGGSKSSSKNYDTDDMSISSAPVVSDRSTVSVPSSSVRISSDLIRIEEQTKSLAKIDFTAQQTPERATEISNSISALVVEMQNLRLKFKQMEQIQIRYGTESGKEEKKDDEERSPLESLDSGSFLRAHDLVVKRRRSTGGSNRESFLSLSSSDNDESDRMGDIKDIMPLNGAKAPSLIEALTKLGYKYATDEGKMWTPTSDAQKVFDKREGTEPTQSEAAMSWSPLPWYQPRNKKEIFVWSGKFDHGGHGSHLPAIKTRGIINCSAKNLVELIVDSNRVKEYNGFALGRTDEFYFQEGLETDLSDSSLGIAGDAKLIRSLSKPPLIRKPLEFYNIMHARKLSKENGEMINGYVCTTRSVWEKEEYAVAFAAGGKSDIPTNTSRSELLLGVNIMRDLDGELEGWCELTTLSHMNSPGVPLSLAKRIGLSAAVNNIKSLQSIWE
uniref:START domain-containing protein n=2 Tax=Ditylum brightwellii TaxID=49249 RepID=A0A7S4VX38_9STRA